MIKFFSVFVFLTMSIFSNSSFDSIEVQSDIECVKYGTRAMNAEYQAYGFANNEEVQEAYQYYYNACVSAGGADNILDPVFM
ncbi:hypothetical protein [Psychroserpens sp. SPM9]|uniref:hypothetical protein n=1 Tax=Psychroserpens sp. SPM9 TaxID=2975598 RepID=UPI0021A76388|nr:hypothetical protein [Psychroserpens sp. SPM9]MDG5491166.1 hypothetical protein [Psychroserpens sp. SPM9]